MIKGRWEQPHPKFYLEFLVQLYCSAVRFSEIWQFKLFTPNRKRNGKKNGKGKGRNNNKNRDVTDYTQLIKRQLKKATKGMFAIAGEGLGERLGERVGMRNEFGRMGRKLGGQMARITGFGDYEVKNNTLLAPSVVPDFGLNSVRITHKEYLGNVMGSTAFVGKTYYINPGLSETFPWLSGIARNYQQFRVNGLIFQYVSTSAYALGTTNSALGKVILATNYNAEDPPFTATTGMLATQFSTYCRPADSIMHALECARGETASNLLYVRTDLDGNNKDKRLTDLGFTEVAREGMQSTTEVGGLWISYDITLLKPILNPQNAMSDGFDQFVMLSNNDNLWDSKITPRNNYLGGTFVSLYPDMLGMRYTFESGISSGFFLNVIEITCGPTSKITDGSAGGTYGTLTNCVLVVDDDKDGPFNGAYNSPADPQYMSNLREEGSIIDSTCIVTQMLQVTGPNPTLSLVNLGLTGPGVYWRWSLYPISYRTSPEVPSD